LPLKNDLTNCVEGQHAEGEAFNLQGQVLSQTGIPIADALVEIWQVDARGHYAVEVDAKRDTGFAGYGRCLTDVDGRYNFITIKPSGYSRYGGLIKRAAHIHVRVSAAGLKTLTSEIWFDGAAGNESDSFIRRITEKELRQRMLLQLIPVPGGRPVARFNIILES
jgi:protocatechuate 3,4-dioxygenase beta subunit